MCIRDSFKGGHADCLIFFPYLSNGIIQHAVVHIPDIQQFHASSAQLPFIGKLLAVDDPIGVLCAAVRDPVAEGIKGAQRRDVYKRQMQNDVYAKMSGKGWYPAQTADQTEIDKTRQKFASA